MAIWNDAYNAAKGAAGRVRDAAQSVVGGAPNQAAQQAASSGTPVAGAQQTGGAADFNGDYAAYYASLSPEERKARAYAEAAARGPTYLEKWEGVMPGSYNLGGDPNAANAYAAQAQQTGAQASAALNQAAAMSQGVGYEMGSQLAAAGQNYGEALAGQAMAAGQGLSSYGQQQAAGIQQYGQQAAQGINDLGQGAQSYGEQQAGRIAGQGNAALGYGIGQAAQVGGSAAQLGQMGQGVFGQANAAQNRNIIGSQQRALQGIEAREGPSAAQAQLQSGLNQAQSSNLALARSGRGWGGSAAAMAQAQGQNAAMGQNAANASAQLRAQENAAYRSRAAQNLAAAGQLGLGQANVNDAQQRAMIAAGMQGVQAGGQMQAQAAGLGQNAYAQQLAAQQAAAGVGQQGYAQNLAAQQAAGQLGVGALQGGAQLGANAMQAGGAMQLGGLEAGGNMSMAGIQGGGNMQLAGLGQGGQLAGQAGVLDLSAQQAALAAQQQQVANNMAYQNQMISLHQGAQQVGMNNANNAAAADENAKQRAVQYFGATMNALGLASSQLSDRNEKKGIEPANPSVLIPSTGAAGGYDFGTGISGPNQADRKSVV